MRIKTLLAVSLLSFSLMQLAYSQGQLLSAETRPDMQTSSPIPKMTFGSKRLAKKLVQATLAGDHEEIKKLIEKGADINLPVKGEYSHYTPLGECLSYISACSEDTIKLLLKNGADIKKLKVATFKAGEQWSPINGLITRSITQSIDNGNYTRFKFLMDMFPDHAFSSVEHMKLYSCYSKDSIGVDCGSRNNKWPQDFGEARWHLEKSVSLFDGKTHDGKLNFYSDPRYTLAMNIHNALGTWAKQYNFQNSKAAWPIEDAVPYCERAVEWLKPRAEEENKNHCSNPGVFFYCDDGSGKKFGTGTGYSSIRTLLNNCLYYTKDHDTWERLLKTRMNYFSLREDVKGPKSWLLSHAEYRYKKNNDMNSARKFADMRIEAVEDAAILKKNNWDPSRKFYGDKARRWLAEQEQKERDGAIVAQRRRKELREWSAQSDREQEKAWANSKSQDDELWGNIKKIERQTKSEINASERAYQKSQKSSNHSAPTNTNSSSRSYKGKQSAPSRSTTTTSSYDAEKQNCLNAGKTWNVNRSCNYGNDVKIQGWSEGNRVTVQRNGQQNSQAGNSYSSSQSTSSAGSSNSSSSVSSLDNTSYAESENKTQNAIKAEAYCWTTKLKKYMCDGPLQRLQTSYSTMEKAQEMVDCRNATYLGNNWYDCNRALKSSERDVRALR